TAQTVPVDQNNTFKHTVVKGETVYSISKMYHTTVNEVYRYNPGASEGIGEGQILTIPQRRVISEVKEENYRYHTILPKETLYSVSKTYKLKPEDVMRANPGLSVETFSIGKTIRVPFFESYEVVTPYDNQTTNISHLVLRGETLYSIARRYNVEVNEIERINPMLSGGLKTNMELIIPVKRSSIEGDTRSVENDANRLLSQSRPSQSVDVMKVGLLLPFLDEAGRGHLRLQEYYEGFLLAVEELKNDGANLELYVFEIGKGDNTQKLESLLGTMEMKSLHFIIGGVSDAQIRVISDFSKAYNIKYVVPFSQSNGEVLNNGNIFQVNPLSSATYTKASLLFLETFRNANVIFVSGGRNDKMEFLSELQLNLRKNNVKYETITTSGSLSASILPLLSKSKENVIIPASADANTLRVIIDELKKVQETDPTYVNRLFGHPEWQTYTNLVGDYHLFGTYIYTPFFIDDEDTGTKRFRDNFRNWYDRNLMETYPSYGLWGYDTGLFFLTALRRNGTHFEQNIQRIRVNSLQFAFHFERLNNWGGLINNGLYLVHYDRNGQIIKTDKSR
ncbi:MAG: LysM peptidoglycan-binding domain-containing protein, partial [Proteiniphilum sp.]|nr:LysM peptidoglycan-binding domain-containing protein [Proteiniphilum sp.]